MVSCLTAALDFVLPPWSHTPQPAAPRPVAASDDERLAAANFRLFDLNAEARYALARQQCGSAPRSVRGRVGPPQVTVDLGSATPFLTVSGPSDGTSLAPLSLESAQGFSSCRANTAVLSGRWQYEVGWGGCLSRAKLGGKLQYWAMVVWWHARVTFLGNVHRLAVLIGLPDVLQVQMHVIAALALPPGTSTQSSQGPAYAQPL